MKKIIKTFIKLIILAVILVIGINIYVIKSTEDQIIASIDSRSDSLSPEETDKLKKLNADCIMVLGASVHVDGTPSPMLKDRLDTGIELYHAKTAPKLLLTGDDGQEEYNEVAVMRQYAIDHGVREEDIFLDHAGFSTYESVYRAEYIFEVRKMIVVTQGYHLHRALHACNRLGIKAAGTASDQETYAGQTFREIREILARNKDFVKLLVKPDPTFLGETIPISGSGIETH